MFKRLKLSDQALFDALYQHSPVGVCVIDRDHHVVRCNKAMERINRRELAPGDTFHGPSEHSDLEKKVRQHVEIVLGLGEPELKVVVIGRLPGDENDRRFLCDYMPLEHEGEFEHVVALMREVDRPIDSLAALSG